MVIDAKEALLDGLAVYCRPEDTPPSGKTRLEALLSNKWELLPTSVLTLLNAGNFSLKQAHQWWESRFPLLPNPVMYREEPRRGRSRRRALRRSIRDITDCAFGRRYSS